MTDYLSNPKDEIVKSLLPDGDNYEVVLTTTDIEVEQCEKSGFHFIGRGLFEDKRFCAYLKLNRHLRR